MKTARLSLSAATRGLGTPERILDIPAQRVDRAEQDLKRGLTHLTQRAGDRLASLRLTPESLGRELARLQEALHSHTIRLKPAMNRTTDRQQDRLTNLGALLTSYSYENVLDRGFALAVDTNGKIITSSAAPKEGDNADLRFKGRFSLNQVRQPISFLG